MTTLSFPFLRAMEKPKRSINRMETPPPLAQLPENLSAERVLEVQHYTNRLFGFTITRPASFRFRAGEFVMIGLRTAERPLMRAYSIASAPSAEALEFYSIIVPDGPLTSRLCQIKPGDEVLMARKATGTLVLDALTPATRLFLVSTGTGFAPFASILREPETYAKFKQVIVTHTCRDAAELRYSADVVNALPDDPLVGEAAAFHVMRYATCTRGSCQRRGRIRDCYNTFTTLFDDDDTRRLLEQSAVIFFGDLNRILQDYCYLQVCKITDPPKTGGRANLTVEAMNIALESAGLLSAEVKQHAAAMMRYRNFIKAPRNRLISHLDAKTVLRGGEIGGHDAHEVTAFFEAMQTYCDEVGRAVGEGPLDFRWSAGTGDAIDLLRVLRQASTAAVA